MTSTNQIWYGLLAVVALVALAGCGALLGGDSGTPQPTATVTEDSTPISTSTSTPTATAEPTETATPTATETATATPTPEPQPGIHLAGVTETGVNATRLGEAHFDHLGNYSFHYDFEERYRNPGENYDQQSDHRNLTYQNTSQTYTVRERSTELRGDLRFWGNPDEMYMRQDPKERSDAETVRFAEENPYQQRLADKMEVPQFFQAMQVSEFEVVEEREDEGLTVLRALSVDNNTAARQLYSGEDATVNRIRSWWMEVVVYDDNRIRNISHVYELGYEEPGNEPLRVYRNASYDYEQSIDVDRSWVETAREESHNYDVSLSDDGTYYIFEHNGPGRIPFGSTFFIGSPDLFDAERVSGLQPGEVIYFARTEQQGEIRGYSNRDGLPDADRRVELPEAVSISVWEDNQMYGRARTPAAEDYFGNPWPIVEQATSDG